MVNLFFGDINIWSGVNNTAEVRGSATLSEKRVLHERLGSRLNTKVYRSQVHDAGKESKGESVYVHEHYISEEIMEESRK